MVSNVSWMKIMRKIVKRTMIKKNKGKSLSDIPSEIL
jgi:hypothetical protein